MVLNIEYNNRFQDDIMTWKGFRITNPFELFYLGS